VAGGGEHQYLLRRRSLNAAACCGSSRRGCLPAASSFGLRQDAGDVRDEFARELELRPAPEVVRAALVVQLDGVVVGAERLLRQIRRQQRNAFLRALLGGVALEVLALGGEADAERRVLHAR